MTTPDTSAGHWAARYSVPWSQVHPNSTGAQSGKVHLVWYSPGPDRPAVELHTQSGCRRWTIRREYGRPLCGRKITKRSPWYDREPNLESWDDRCPGCVEFAERYGVDWSAAVGADLMLPARVTS